MKDSLPPHSDSGRGRGPFADIDRLLAATNRRQGRALSSSMSKQAEERGLADLIRHHDQRHSAARPVRDPLHWCLHRAGPKGRDELPASAHTGPAQSHASFRWTTLNGVSG